MLLSTQISACLTWALRLSPQHPDRMQLSTGPAPATHTHIPVPLCLGFPNIVVADLEDSQLRFYLPLSAVSALRSLPRAHLLPGLKDCVHVSQGSQENSFDTEMDHQITEPWSAVCNWSQYMFSGSRLF